MTETQEPIGFLIEAHAMERLREIERALHGGTDRERDYGHRIWLILNGATPINTTDA